MMRSLACNGWIRVQDAAARRILRVQSALRIALCRLRYPNVAISFDSFVGRNVVIRARRGAQIRLTSVELCDGVRVWAEANAIINIRKSHLGVGTIVVAHEKITMGPHCEVAEYVTIRDQNHRFGDPTMTLRQQRFVTAPIEIGENVWIGCKATILMGVTIGDRAVIGANAVVNRNVPAGEVHVGVPAHRVALSTGRLYDEVNPDTSNVSPARSDGLIPRNA